MSDQTQEKPQATPPSFKPYDVDTPSPDNMVTEGGGDVSDHHNEIAYALKVASGEAEEADVGEPVTPSEEEEHHEEVQQALEVQDEESEESEAGDEDETTAQPDEPAESGEPPTQVLTELIRTEENIKREREQLRAEKAQWEQQVQQLQQYAQQVQQENQSFKENLHKDPVGTLAREGLTLNKLAEIALADPDGTQAAQAAAQNRPNEEIQKLQSQVQQLTQYIQNKETYSKVEQQVNSYEQGIVDLFNTDDFKIVQTMPGGLDAARKRALMHATQYMQTHNVGPEAFTPADAAAIIRDDWSDYLRSIDAYDAALKKLGVPQSTVESEVQASPPAPTLTQHDSLPPPRGEVIDDEPGSHDDEIRRALGKVAPGAHRGFN